MTADSGHGPGWLIPTADGHGERFAALIEDRRPRLLELFAERIEAVCGLGPDDRPFFEQLMAAAGDVLGDVQRSVRAAAVRVDDRRAPDAWAFTGAGREEPLFGSDDALSAAVLLLNTVMAELTACVQADQELLPCFAVAVTGLNESISRRIQATAGACAASALDRVHRAQVEERRRVARELHDRVGEALSIGLRRLDLAEIVGRPEPPGQADIARLAVAEAMRRLRVVTSDLREPPVASLEKALIGYLESVRADTEVRLEVSGDEAWAPPAVLDEVFLIVREAVRNALTHGAPRLVLIAVEVSPHELTARVSDDGRGFTLVQAAGPGAVGTGLASMRERAALMRGRATVSSTPGQGTRVDLSVPLPGEEPVGG
jgi:signal transduction histidine kinase